MPTLGVPAEPINTFHGIQHHEDEPIRVSYHRNIHYNSVVNPNKATIGVGLGLPSFKPGVSGAGGVLGGLGGGLGVPELSHGVSCPSWGALGVPEVVLGASPDPAGGLWAGLRGLGGVLGVPMGAGSCPCPSLCGGVAKERGRGHIVYTLPYMAVGVPRHGHAPLCMEGAWPAWRGAWPRMAAGGPLLP